MRLPRERMNVELQRIQHETGKTVILIFGRDLPADPAKEERLAHMVEPVLHSLRP